MGHRKQRHQGMYLRRGVAASSESVPAVPLLRILMEASLAMQLWGMAICCSVVDLLLPFFLGVSALLRLLLFFGRLSGVSSSSR